MKGSVNRNLAKFLRTLATAIVPSGTGAAPLTYAGPSDKPIVVQPVDLPELAPQTGQTMLLHDSVDGRTLLYIEQQQGARPAIFDVTNPAPVKRDGSVQLNAPAPFDFVSTLGNRAEVVRLRQGQGVAGSDLSQANVPILKTVQRLTLHGTTTPLGDDGFSVSSPPKANAQPSQDSQTVEIPSSEEFKGVET